MFRLVTANKRDTKQCYCGRQEEPAQTNEPAKASIDGIAERARNIEVNSQCRQDGNDHDADS